MAKFSILFIGTLALCLAGCTTYNIGSSHDSDPNGSYAGSTLNSPVTDQNPHVGGDASYSATSTDAGKPVSTPDKSDGR